MKMKETKRTKGINRTAKASVFEDLFSDKENLLALYLTLHPEDTEVTVDDLEYITLKNILTSGRYNDLGFMVGNRLMILVEAQSTWSENILPRSIIYFADSLNRYVIGQRFDLYGPAPIEIPEPELYVIYSGDKMIPKDRITLSEAFFHGKKLAVDVEVKVLQYTNTNNIVDQYISFCKIFDQQIKLYADDPEKGVRETIRICGDKKILEKYLQGRKEEVVNIMLTLFDQEYATKIMVDRERKEAKQEGRAEGVLLSQINSIKQLMQNLSLSEEEAMNALGIPEEEREKLRERLKQ